MPDVELPHKFIPRHYQRPVMKAVIEDGVKRAVCVWHRRAGKDKTFLNLLAIKAMETMGNYAYYFPTATLGRKALWDNIDSRSGMRVVDHLPTELVARMNEQQMKITLANGSTIQVLGTETLDVVGGNPVGVVFSESAQHRPDAWDYIRPILAENGGWAIFNGTPRGKNWFYQLYDMARKNPSWFTQMLTVDDTHVLTPEDIEAERKAGMREEMIAQEFYCDWAAALPGAIYGRVIDMARRENRIAEMPVAGDCLVHTAWDLGGPRHTAVWYWQIVGREIRVIDCDLHFEGSIIQRVDMMNQKGYHYGTDYLPHDAAAMERTGLTFAGELQRLGRKVSVVPRTHDVWIGINHLLEMFGGIVFRSPHTDKGLEALGSYRMHIEELGSITRAEPIHDWASHPADALRTMAEAHRVGLFKFASAAEPRPDYYGRLGGKHGARRKAIMNVGG